MSTNDFASLVVRTKAEIVQNDSPTVHFKLSVDLSWPIAFEFWKLSAIDYWLTKLW